MSAPVDGLALLAALRDAASTPAGRRLVAELAAEVRRSLDAEREDADADPLVAEAARLLERARTRRRARRAGGAR